MFSRSETDGRGQKIFFKKLLDHEIFSSMLPWATFFFFLKKLKNPRSSLLHIQCTLPNGNFVLCLIIRFIHVSTGHFKHSLTIFYTDIPST